MSKSPMEVIKLYVLLQHLPLKVNGIQRSYVVENIGCRATVSNESVTDRYHGHVDSTARFLASLVDLLSEIDAL